MAAQLVGLTFAAPRIGTAMAAAHGSNYAHAKLRQVCSFETTLASFLIGGAFTLPLLFAVPVTRIPSPADYLLLLILGGVMSALAYLIYFRLVSLWGATKAITVEFVVTAVAVLVGAVVLGERLTVLQIAGGAVIITGCCLVLGLIPRRRPPLDVRT